MIRLFLLLFLASLTLNAFAGVVKPSAKFFKNIGRPTLVKWGPERFPNNFKFDVVYYIPKSLENKENAQTLMFLHGGGVSTLTRQGSLDVVADIYLPYLKKLADELQMVVVLPSASGLNWSAHTSATLRDLTHQIREDLNIDQNNIGLSGHSMGGMGITRVYHYLADEFAYFLPMAAGMEIRHQTEDRLIKLFNVPLLHLQGIYDHFTDFVSRSQEKEKRLAELSKKYDEKSLFELSLFKGTHDFDYPLFKSSILKLQKNPRNIYQKNLYGILHYNNQNGVENKIPYNRGSDPRYFWIEIKEASAPASLNFIAKIKDNRISIETTTPNNHIKSIRVYLSRKMLSSEKPFSITVNDKLEVNRILTDKSYVHFADSSFSFDDFEDIEL